jgi:hypothetical protein
MLCTHIKQAEQADKANQTRARWFFCALSKVYARGSAVSYYLTLLQRPLQEPIVSCALGKLYNKDAIIEYLLDKSAYGDGEDICGHIRSLKVCCESYRLISFDTNDMVYRMLEL